MATDLSLAEMAQRIDQLPLRLDAIQHAALAAEGETSAIDDALQDVTRRSESLRRRLADKLNRAAG